MIFVWSAGGATVAGSTGSGWDGATVTVEVALMPPNSALTVTVPALVPAVTRPDVLTDATEVDDVDHVAVAVTFCVEVSLDVAVAVSCSVAPELKVADGGVTLSDVIVGGTVTVIVAEPLIAPIVAVITAVPAVVPAVTRPEGLTVAVADADVDHVAVAATSLVVPSL